MSSNAAARQPAPLVGENDPVWRAALSAPFDDTPDTEEERAAIEEATRTGYHATSGPAVTAQIARRA
jgi:hypothetical protein